MQTVGVGSPQSSVAGAELVPGEVARSSPADVAPQPASRPTGLADESETGQRKRARYPRVLQDAPASRLRFSGLLTVSLVVAVAAVTGVWVPEGPIGAEHAAPGSTVSPGDSLRVTASAVSPTRASFAQDSSRALSRPRIETQLPGPRSANPAGVEHVASADARALGTLHSQSELDSSLASRLWSSWREFLRLQITVQSVFLFAAFVLLWQAVSSAFAATGSRRATLGLGMPIASIVKIVVCGGMIVALVSYLLHVPAVTAMSFAAASLALVGVIAVGPGALQRLVRRAANPRTRVRHLLIVGTNSRAIAFARRIEANHTLGYRLVGFVDQHWSGETQFQQSGYAIVSDFAGFGEFLKDHVVDEVLICAPMKSLYERSSQVFAQCEEQGITVRYGSDLFNSTIGHVRADRLGEDVLLTVGMGRQAGPRLFAKSVIDVVGAAVLIPLLLPLGLLIAAAIKLGSRGPVLFVQERVGLNKRRFRMYKFRTMGVDAEKRQADLVDRNEISGPVFKIRHDPRVTRIGRLLRKTSLDELPQLLNVLKGDMSLVGPRPLAVRDYSGFTEDWHRRRLSVRPGMTGLWQVMGRNSIPFERWMELDLEYIDNWSLRLDFLILLKTLPAVMRGSGAS